MDFRPLTISLLSLVGGCSSIFPQLKPESISTEITRRHIEGRYKPFKVHRTIPFGRIEEEYPLSLDPKINTYSRFDFTQGKTGVSRYHVRGEIEGNMQSLGIGIKYYPHPNLSLNIGAETFRADLNVDANLGPLNYQFTDDNIFGWGASISATANIPLTENITLSLEAGYNETDNITHYLSFNFDGAYTAIGIKITLP